MQVSIASDDKTEIVECLDKEAECPKGYYADRNPREPLDYLVGHGVVCIFICVVLLFVCPMWSSIDYYKRYIQVFKMMDATLGFGF